MARTGMPSLRRSRRATSARITPASRRALTRRQQGEGDMPAMSASAWRPRACCHVARPTGSGGRRRREDIGDLIASIFGWVQDACPSCVVNSAGRRNQFPEDSNRTDHDRSGGRRKPCRQAMPQNCRTRRDRRLLCGTDAVWRDGRRRSRWCSVTRLRPTCGGWICWTCRGRAS